MRLPRHQPAVSLAVGRHAAAAAATRVPRAHHIDKITDDAGLAFFLGLTALPKASHLSTCSYRARRESSQQLLTGLIRRLRPLGLASGEEGFNGDFHAIRHHGDDPVLEEHYVPARSQRTRSVLTFFASDHASGEMVYANADITKTGQAREIIAFADYRNAATGQDPALLVSGSQLTTYKILDELSARRITWLTLRQRGKAELARLAGQRVEARPADICQQHDSPRPADRTASRPRTSTDFLYRESRLIAGFRSNAGPPPHPLPQRPHHPYQRHLAAAPGRKPRVVTRGRPWRHGSSGRLRMSYEPLHAKLSKRISDDGRL